MRAAAANGNGQGPSWLLAAQQLLQKVLGSQDEVSRQHRATPWRQQPRAARGHSANQCRQQTPRDALRRVPPVQQASPPPPGPRQTPLPRQRSRVMTTQRRCRPRWAPPSPTGMCKTCLKPVLARATHPPLSPPLFDAAVDAASIGSGPAAAQSIKGILSLNLFLSLAVPLPAGTRMA